MTALVRQLAIILALLVLIACGGAAARETEARRDARRLYREGLDHAARLQHARAADLMRQSLLSDATYLPALSFLLTDGANSFGLPKTLYSIAERTADSSAAQCLRRAAATPTGLGAPAPDVRSPSSGARLCHAFVALFHEVRPPSQSTLDTLALLATVFPELPSLAIEPLKAAIAGKDPDAIRNAIRSTTRVSHPMERAQLLTWLARALHDVRADSAALSLDDAIFKDPAWELPGFRAIVGAGMFNHIGDLIFIGREDPVALRRHGDSVAAAANSVRGEALRWGDQRARIRLLFEIGASTTDRGMIDEAIPYLVEAVPLSDSLGDAGWRAISRMRLGRALVKAGRAGEAEDLLLAARGFADSAELPFVQREVEHNLLHLYESLRRDADARHAGERFVRFASIGPLHAVRMMSARDVGRFLRSRGFVEDSRRYFERMLADIDSLGTYRNYAGEYYELTGDLDQAAAEYEKSARRQDDALNAVAGLVRVSLTMGDTAAARRWAELHDDGRQSGGNVETAPLLPAVLRRTVGGAAARQAFLRAREGVFRHGQLAAWANLSADLADLENDLGAYDRAGAIADSAGEAATRVGAADIALRARALAAYARVRRGATGADDALAELERLGLEADRTSGVLLRAEVRRLLGGARASRGRWRDGLEEYRRAVTPLDSIAGEIAMDPGQAAFRSAQRRAYDEALATIVHNASAPGAPVAYAAWSTRRKGRSYAVRWPVNQAGGIPRPDPGTAIVDYVLLDSIVAVLVVTTDAARIIRLKATPAVVRADVKALRRSVDVRVGSSVDVGRAEFPLLVAHRLYNALLAPLDSLVRSHERLIIVPDGILALVPFDALVTSLPDDPADYRRAGFVLDRQTVTNATILWSNPASSRASTRRVAIIDPGGVPDAGREVGAVSSALRASVVRHLQGRSANRRETLDAMRNVDIVHFAVHARANEHDPGSSQIDLAAHDGDDGRLGASEVASLRLDAPLVVLSACETANGVVFDGEGVLSMSRSFLRAGARATVATLWPVGPGAAEFAGAFYADIVASKDAASALRKAKVALRTRGMPPSLWAPYQLFAAPANRGASSETVATGG